MILNVQITDPKQIGIPTPPLSEYVESQRIDENAPIVTCNLCDGTGFYKPEQLCRRCYGKGRDTFIKCIRFNVPASHYEVVADWCAALPPELKKQRTISIAEYGGCGYLCAVIGVRLLGCGYRGAVTWYTNTGTAQIVCGLHGEQLVAVHGVPKCNANHASFYVHAALVVRYSQHRGVGEGKVWLVGVDRHARQNIGIYSYAIWRFADGEEPVRLRETSLTFPHAARAAAFEKARIYHCRSACYAIGGAHGPSGALTGAGAAFGGLPSPLKGPGIGYIPS